jgi:hypothetical protein
MPDAISFADLDEQRVELLPARTVLSLLSAGTGALGEPDNGVSNGQQAARTTWMVIFGYEPSSASDYRFAFTDVGKAS